MSDETIEIPPEPRDENAREMRRIRDVLTAIRIEGNDDVYDGDLGPRGSDHRADGKALWRESLAVPDPSEVYPWRFNRWGRSIEAEALINEWSDRSEVEYESRLGYAGFYWTRFGSFAVVRLRPLDRTGVSPWDCVYMDADRLKLMVELLRPDEILAGPHPTEGACFRREGMEVGFLMPFRRTICESIPDYPDPPDWVVEEDRVGVLRNAEERDEEVDDE